MHDKLAPRLSLRAVSTGSMCLLGVLALSSGCAKSDADTGSPDDASDAGRRSPDEQSDAGTTPGDAPRRLKRAVRAAVDGILGYPGSSPGYSVAVWHDGQVVYAEGFGSENEDGDAVTPATLFGIGSDTKKITAIALLQQVQAGKLELDDRVGDLLPGLDLERAPGQLASTTVDDLLAQRSGLFDYTPWVRETSDAFLAELVEGRFRENEFALMPPGIAFSYSNPNYILLGYLTERLTERVWPEIVREDVFAPLGMDHSYGRIGDALAAGEDVASGFGVSDEFDSFDPMEDAFTPPPDFEWVSPEQQVDCAALRPAGLVWSTASDQARLLGFLAEGAPDVLSEDLLSALTNVRAPEYAHAPWGYGYGVYRAPFYPATTGAYYDRAFMYHGGNTTTMSSASLVLPELAIAVSVLGNAAYDSGVDWIAASALEAAAGDELGEPSEVTILPEPADLERYVATYRDVSLGEVVLRLEEGQLWIDIPLFDDYGLAVSSPLEPVGLDLFTFDVNGETVDIGFYDGEDGVPATYGVNRAFVLTRQ